MTEDMKVQYNGTVTDASGKVFQMAYGGDGLDPVNTVKVDGEQEVCDISRMVAKLNMEHEVKLEEEAKKQFEKNKRENEGMKRGGAVKKYASGGSVGSASKRADGIAQRGKTKGRIC